MQMPPLIYGTAWKKEKTADWVVEAVREGFRGIDTAAQPKHYYEKGVGDALRVLNSEGFSREDLFLQTKFTPISGQAPNSVPYDPLAPLEVQVAESFSSSLQNLGTHYVDSLVLHSPLPRWDQMMRVWGAMEKLHASGGVGTLGISNCYDLEVLKALYEQSQTKPQVVQNRFYSQTGYDQELREWAAFHGMTYQSFWTLTANPHLLSSHPLLQMADNHKRTTEQVFFRFVTQLGIVPLIGTTSNVHMKQDLEVFQFQLNQEEIERLRALLV